MSGSDKSASGTSGTCDHSRTGTAIRVAGTEDHLTRPNFENTSEPTGQVNRPHDQPELKKQRQWSHNQNKEVMYCYYMAIKDKPRGYQRRMHQQWKDRGNIECTEQQLCDQKKQIEDKTLLTPAKIEEVKQQVKSDTFKEEDYQQSEEEQQAATTILEPVEREVIPEPEDPIPPTYLETPDDDDSDYDYDQLKYEYIELLEEVKSQPMKERKKLSKLKNDKKLKRVVKTLDKIIEETSTDNMDLTTINQMQYTAVLLMTNKITLPKPTTNRKLRGRPPAWQQRLQKQIDQLRGDMAIITEYTNGNTTNKVRRKLKTILKKHKITADEQLIAYKEDLKQEVQAKAQRIEDIPKEVRSSNRIRCSGKMSRDSTGN